MKKIGLPYFNEREANIDMLSERLERRGYHLSGRAFYGRSYSAHDQPLLVGCHGAGSSVRQRGETPGCKCTPRHS